MLSELVALVAGGVLGAAPAIYAVNRLDRALQNAEGDRAALLDRVQSPDLASYYGARAAWHPEEFPAPEPVEYLRDDFGYVEQPVDGDGRLPGELPSSEL